MTTSAGDPHEVHARAEGRGHHGVPRRAVAARRAEGRRRGRRRARRRRQRGRRLQGADRRVDDGAAAAHRGAGRRADHRGRRHLRRAFDGGRDRARRRRRADGHAHGERGGVAGARQLEAAHLLVDRGRHAAAEPALAARVPRAAHRVQRSGRARGPRGDPEPAKRCTTSTSAATWKRRSRSAARSRAASTR